MSAPRFRIYAAASAHVFQFTRFLATGLVNTAVGYGVYLGLLRWTSYEIAYAAAYVIGIVVAYVLNSLFVFRSPIGLRTALRYPFVYLAQYLFGAGLLYAMARVLADHHINLHSARINTLGDRAEDVFLISGEPLADPKAVLRIEQELLGVLQV